MRQERSVWVYERGKCPRPSSALRGESAEHGYFAGASSGEKENAVDGRFNDEYERPFNEMLPRLDLGLFDSASHENRQVLAEFFSHILFRCQASKLGQKESNHLGAEAFEHVANDAWALTLYAARLSVLTRRAIGLQELHTAIYRARQTIQTSNEMQTQFVDRLLRRDRNALAETLASCYWSLVENASPDSFFISDTPVVSVRWDPMHGYTFGNGILRKSTVWFMPISPRLGLAVSQTWRPSFLKVGRRITALLNYAQITTMFRRLYGAYYDCRIDAQVQTYGGMYRFHRDVFRNDPAVAKRFAYEIALRPL